MKKILFSIAALFAMTAAVSCEQENLGSSAKDGDLVDVTFTVSYDELVTKAIGEADMHKELKFAAYIGETYLPNIVHTITHFGNGHEATIKVTLAKGQEYNLVFWAQKTDSKYYTLDFKNHKMTVNYDQNCNDEGRDAFYKVVTDYTTSQGNKEIVLRRPFAQVNVGTSFVDYSDAVKAGITIDKTEVVMKDLGNELNLLTGETTGSVEATFKSNAIPAENLKIYKDKEAYENNKPDEYKYLALNYVLVSGDSNDTDNPSSLLDNGGFKVKFYEGNSMISSITLSNVPVQKNYRTNIIGSSLLTSSSEFTVKILPDFYGEYDKDGGHFDKVEY